MTLQNKYQSLKEYLVSLERVAVAFSGGVDSTFLLQVAVDVLGADCVIAVTEQSALFPKREMEETRAFCEKQHIKQIVFEPDIFQIEGFEHNPENRCYLCKHALFEQILDIAREHQIKAVAEGSNVDDEGDYRPGLKAIAELGIKSPLRQAGLTKQDIRDLSRKLGLPTWNKPSFACLASRFVYGETISTERLEMVEQAEQLLLDLGFHQFRVRIHGEGKSIIARIEIEPAEFSKILDPLVREKISSAFKACGFAYTTLDLIGYRTGSMNEQISAEYR